MARQTNHLRGVLLAVGGAACWSPDGLLLRIVQADAWQSLFWRMVSFAAALMLVHVVRERGNAINGFRTVGGPGLWIGFFVAAVNASFIYSITHTAVANTLVIFATIPLFGAVFGWIFLREAVPVRTLATMTIGVLCIGAIFAEKLAQGSIVGDLLALAAALLFAGNLTVVRRHPDVSLLPPMVLGGLMGAAIGAGFSDPFAVSARDILLLVASGAVQQTAAFFLFLSGARWLPPGEVGLLSLVETVLGPLWVWLALDERPPKVAHVAGTIVIASLAGHSLLSLKAEQSAGRPDKTPPG